MTETVRLAVWNTAGAFHRKADIAILVEVGGCCGEHLDGPTSCAWIDRESGRGVAVLGGWQIQSLPARLDRARLIETRSEFFNSLFETIETFLSHLGGETHTSLCSDDGGPKVVDHTGSISLVHANDCEPDALFQAFGGVRRV